MWNFLTNICSNFVNNIHLVFRYSEFSNTRPAEYTTDAEKRILVVLKIPLLKESPLTGWQDGAMHKFPRERRRQAGGKEA